MAVCVIDGFQSGRLKHAAHCAGWVEVRGFQYLAGRADTGLGWNFQLDVPPRHSV
jgi:hypothetical protein